jgi:hypothetical protein
MTQITRYYPLQTPFFVTLWYRKGTVYPPPIYFVFGTDEGLVLVAYSFLECLKFRDTKEYITANIRSI